MRIGVTSVKVLSPAAFPRQPRQGRAGFFSCSCSHRPGNSTRHPFPPHPDRTPQTNPFRSLLARPSGTLGRLQRRQRKRNDTVHVCINYTSFPPPPVSVYIGRARHTVGIHNLYTESSIYVAETIIYLLFYREQWYMMYRYVDEHCRRWCNTVLYILLFIPKDFMKRK